MSDGVKLSVTYFMPVSANFGEKFPVLLEMDPYRKDDIAYLEDYPLCSYFAKRGYVVAKVDVRGTGSSEGVLPTSEYTEQELSDGVEIINQLSRSAWSNGNVGMFGLSWSGFNSLMIAARKPPALKAILIAHGSDDLFYQDVHYIDGVIHMDCWEPMIDTSNALPATDEYAITSEYFANRFDQTPWHFVWKENQKDGPFWREKSVRFKPDIEIPVYLIGGLLDGYRDTIPRMMNSSNTRIKADLGPWNHAWPNTGTPGPNYEWRAKAVRWWDMWLKGVDTGIMNEPRFMVFVRDGDPPLTVADVPEGHVSPGEWRCGDWPVKGIEMRRFYPDSNHYLIDSVPEKSVGNTLPYIAGSGIGIHTWWGEMTSDMAGDDEAGLVYDSAPLAEPVEIIGSPVVHLKVSADAPHYQWTVRLEDVWPDGKVSLVSGTLINPADRISRLERIPLIPNSPTDLYGEIHYTTWKFSPGHRIRLSVSNAQFPMAWPTPYKGSTTLYMGPGTSLDLPVVMKNTLTGTCDLPQPEPEEGWPDAESGKSKPVNTDYPQYHDSKSGQSVYTTGDDSTWTIGNRSYHTNELNTWRVNDNDPAHAQYESIVTDEIMLPDRTLRLVGVYTLTSDEKAFTLSVSKKLYENETLIREKTWNDVIPRDLQ